MVPLLVAVVTGIAVGMLRRPLGAHLEDPRVLVPGLAAVAVGLHLSLWLLSPAVAGPLLGLSLFLLTGFGLLNLHLVGMGILTTGLALNAAVVLVNGAMPVRTTAVVAAGIAAPGELVLVDLGAGRRYEATGDWLPILGDVIPVAPIGAVVSFGDLIVLMGVGVVAADLVRYTRRPRPGSTGVRLGDRLAAQLVAQDRVDGQALRVGDGGQHGEQLHGADHVVDPEHRLGDRGGHRGDRRQGARVAMARRGPGQRADEVLAGEGHQERPAELGHAADAVDQVEGLAGRLGEVDTRVEEHLLT